jgi:hypothetical protein
VERTDLGAIISLSLVQGNPLEMLNVNLNFIEPSTRWSPACKLDHTRLYFMALGHVQACYLYVGGGGAQVDSQGSTS